MPIETLLDAQDISMENHQTNINYSWLCHRSVYLYLDRLQV